MTCKGCRYATEYPREKFLSRYNFEEDKIDNISDVRLCTRYPPTTVVANFCACGNQHIVGRYPPVSIESTPACGEYKKELVRTHYDSNKKNKR
jgi:hypothetical protein